ncbi:hypothetical protein K504DRAFT_446114 [Pleomassaria siparia CBS 279.74]|uniref:Uncharacterized protein n=1 Tax=Pleomassaria siparia CBS 279.74 TaxID=1314801 RepID=A0A6G1KQV5_9PLEO|nr:hypothetical protein K504DRAFT_446114 [Pleomassaria siparia CBS 279.74]
MLDAGVIATIFVVVLLPLPPLTLADGNAVMVLEIGAKGTRTGLLGSNTGERSTLSNTRPLFHAGPSCSPQALSPNKIAVLDHAGARKMGHIDKMGGDSLDSTTYAFLYKHLALLFSILCIEGAAEAWRRPSWWRVSGGQMSTPCLYHLFLLAGPVHPDVASKAAIVAERVITPIVTAFRQAGLVKTRIHPITVSALIAWSMPPPSIFFGLAVGIALLAVIVGRVRMPGQMGAEPADEVEAHNRTSMVMSLTTWRMLLSRISHRQVSRRRVQLWPLSGVEWSPR